MNIHSSQSDVTHPLNPFYIQWLSSSIQLSNHPILFIHSFIQLFASLFFPSYIQSFLPFLHSFAQSHLSINLFTQSLFFHIWWVLCIRGWYNLLSQKVRKLLQTCLVVHVVCTVDFVLNVDLYLLFSWRLNFEGVDHVKLPPH